MKFRDLEKVRSIVQEATGLEISYAYDDMVFPEHTVFIIQFDDSNDNNFFCYFREDTESEERGKIMEKLTGECEERKCTLVNKGFFDLVQKGEEVEIHFK